MAESFIPVNGTNPSKNLETAEFDNTGGTVVHREGTFNASPTNFDAKQEVLAATPAADEYGAVTRPIIDGGTLDEVTNVSSVDLVDEVTNVSSVDLVDTLTSITNRVDVVQKTATGDDVTDDTANAARSMIVDPTDTAAKAKVVQCPPGMEAYGLVTRPIQNTDAFGRLRVSEPATLFDSQFQYDKLPFTWDEAVVGSGTSTHDADGSFVSMDTTTANSDSVVRQTFTYHRYQPGKSQLVFCTFDMVAAVTGCRKRVGYFDAENGAYFEEDGGSLSLILRSSVSGSIDDTTNRIAQANWNIDPFDGSGPSGITIDATKALIFCVDFEWLGVGSVRTGFIINGAFQPAHIYHHSNIGNKTYMTTANLPVRYEITNTAGLSIAGKMRQICSTVMSEGGFSEDRGFPFSASNGTTTISVTTRRPIMSIRPKATFNSIVNRGQILIDEFKVFAQTNAVYIELVHGGTLTGASWSSVDADSIVEFDVAATAISGGHVLDVDHADAGGAGSKTFGTSSGSSLLSKIPMALDIAGNQIALGNLTLVCTSMNATSVDVGHINWKELR